MFGHVFGSHRVDLDLLFERFHYDQLYNIRFVPTDGQLADMMAKGYGYRHHLTLTSASTSFPMWATPAQSGKFTA
mgnify:CR=1 FL=1